MIRKQPISMIMTENVITLKKNDDLKTAEKLFKQYNIRHIPVVKRGSVIGIISYTDLLRLSFADITNTNDETDTMVYNMFTVEHVMTKNVACVHASSSIKDVAEIFSQREFHALPVINNDKLIGIVTTTDLIKFLLSQF